MTHYVVVGNGVAGIEAALTIRKRFGPDQATITVIGKETDFFFSRTALMYAYMDRMAREDLEPYERGVWSAQRIGLLRAEVRDLDAGAKTLTLVPVPGVPGPPPPPQLTYDKLLIATGSVPRQVPFEGLEAATSGAVNFVSMQDLERCEQLTWGGAREAVVVGGGLIGIELVECLLHHGIKTTFLVREQSYWPMALTPREGEIVSEHIRHHGVDFRLGCELQRVETDAQGAVCGVVTSAGDRLACQMLGLCVGVVAAVEWLKSVATPPALGARPGGGRGVSDEPAAGLGRGRLRGDSRGRGRARARDHLVCGQAPWASGGALDDGGRGALCASGVL